MATPLFAVLVVIETSDVIFAVDSIPAILAVSRHTFIVFSSNAFAILGLRALYFLLADLRDKFDYLQPGLAVILAFVGGKMILAEWYHIPTFLSLGVIAAILTVAIVASIKLDRPDGHGPDEAIDDVRGEGLELLDDESAGGLLRRPGSGCGTRWGWCAAGGGTCGASSPRCRSRHVVAIASTPPSVSSSSRRAVSTRMRST